MATNTDLVSIQDARTFLNQKTGSEDQLLTFAITKASQLVEAYCNRPLKARAVTNMRITGPRTTKLYVPLFPIDPTKAISIKLDEVVQRVWTKEADGNVLDFDVVVASDNPWDDSIGYNHFYRALGWMSALAWAWPESKSQKLGGIGENNVLLSYTGGYNPVPDDLQLATMYMVQKVFRDAQKQQTDITVVNLPVGGSVAYIDSSMPKLAKAILDGSYKFVAGVAAV